jgi:hypothetical protein
MRTIKIIKSKNKLDHTKQSKPKEIKLKTPNSPLKIKLKAVKINYDTRSYLGHNL